jgi:apolipoprotein N-acyltransferase
MTKKNDWKFFAWAFATIVSFALLSPRWTVPLAAFLAPAMLLWLIRGRHFWRAFLIAAVILTISNLIANYRVMPFPLPLFIPMTLQISIVAAIPYAAYSWLARIKKSGETTLLFPFFQVLLEFGNSFLGGGTWGSIAYTQIDNLPLIQLASVTGLWGITFIVYWFSSLAVYCFESRMKWQRVRGAVVIYGLSVWAILVYGTIRISVSGAATNKTVKVAGISSMNYYLLGIIYQDAFGKTLPFDARKLTQTSPELPELNRGLAEFIKDPFSERFHRSQDALEAFQDSMFHLAAREARGGAKIISFSEALMFTFKPIEGKLIQKGRMFAKEHKVTLLLTTASFIPGSTEFGSKFIENKALMINPFGQIEHIFFKNKPVPVVEPSVAGDGAVPIYNSMYGRLATSICYDADFPALMRQAGEQCAAILLLPSGDWREISPYHANMARLRAVENGLSVLRPVSGAISIACDYTGRIIASREFYDDGEKVVTAHLSTNGVPTLYAQTGDYFPWLCVAAAIVLGFKLRRHHRSTRDAAAA